jgi:hypothetical protein
MEIKKHPYYDLEVTPDGRIFERGKERSTKSTQRYKRLTIVLEPGVTKTLSVHRLVVETYVQDIPEGMVVNHKDGDKYNNHYSNLEVVTPKENTKHALVNNLSKPKRGEESHFAELSTSDILKIYGLIKMFKSNEEIAQEMGLTFKNVSQIRSGRKWKHLFKEHFNKPIKGLNMCLPLTTALSIAEELERGVLNYSQIAEKYGQDASTISKAANKKIWKGFWASINEIKKVYNNQI